MCVPCSRDHEVKRGTLMFRSINSSLRAKRSNPFRHKRKHGLLRRFAPRNDEPKEPLYDLFRMQLRDRLRVVADRAQHFIGVRTDFRCHGGELAAAMGETETAAGKAQAAVGRVDL